jgi:cell division protein FtsQ
VSREESFNAGEPLVARRDAGKWRVPATSGLPTRRVQGYKKVLPSGVSTGAASKNETRSWVRLIGGVFFIAMLGVGAYFAAEPVKQMLARPVGQVTVEGEFLYVGKERTMELINAELHGDFLELNLMRLKTALEADPWVEQASLRRSWPDSLLVKISEQKPIARWGEQGFMNQRGEIIRVESTAELMELPRLDGEETDARRIMQQYQDLAQLLRSRGLEIQALSSDRKKSWRVTLKGNVEIAIGRDQVMEKMRRFITVYDQHLQALWTDVKAIDVRYTNGVAVQWLPDSGAGKQYLKSSS